MLGFKRALALELMSHVCRRGSGELHEDQQRMLVVINSGSDRIRNAGLWVRPLQIVADTVSSEQQKSEKQQSETHVGYPAELQGCCQNNDLARLRNLIEANGRPSVEPAVMTNGAASLMWD